MIDATHDSVPYTCTRPFESVDDWLPVWEAGVCLLDDPEIFYLGKGKLYSEPQAKGLWYDLTPESPVTLGSFVVARLDPTSPPFWDKPTYDMICCTNSVQQTPEPSPDVPPIDLPNTLSLLLLALGIVILTRVLKPRRT